MIDLFQYNFLANQIFLAQLILLGSLLSTRIYILFKSSIFGDKTTNGQNFESLGHYSWHRNCHKFVLAYLANIMANFFQLYLIEHSLFMVYVVSQFNIYKFLLKFIIFLTLSSFRQTFCLAYHWAL